MPQNMRYEHGSLRVASYESGGSDATFHTHPEDVLRVERHERSDAAEGTAAEDVEFFVLEFASPPGEDVVKSNFFLSRARVQEIRDRLTEILAA